MYALGLVSEIDEYKTPWVVLPSSKVHPLKAKSLILVTELGINTLPLSFEQFSNAFSDIVLSPLGKYRSVPVELLVTVTNDAQL